MGNHKFKIGQIVRHKASPIIGGTQMVVLAFGIMEDENDRVNIYALSYEAPSGEFRRVILQEAELVALNFLDED